jgi:rhamnosyltransferase
MSDADILVFMTQDAVPMDNCLIEKLIVPYWDPYIAATYARQVPGRKADLLEYYTRSYNYPEASRIKSAADIPKLGIKTYFCSNVCASYRNETYRELGGFVEKTIFNEDMILAFDIINSGYKIVYTAEARVLHYHNYSLARQFSRNFDLGVSHKQYEHLFKSVRSESEGIKLVKDTMAYLVEKKKYHMIPYLFINSLFKYAGYLLGTHYDLLPQYLVERFSMNKMYWN